MGGGWGGVTKHEDGGTDSAAMSSPEPRQPYLVNLQGPFITASSSSSASALSHIHLRRAALDILSSSPSPHCLGTVGTRRPYSWQPR